MTGKYLAVLLLMTAVLGLGLAQDAGGPDPLPLRRVAIPLERVAAEVERARPGILLQMPREEFEAKVRRARDAAAAARFEPRLVKARYAAQLSGTALVGGSGNWQVQHDGAAPAMLPLPQFNLALSKIKVGNSDGVLGDVDGKTFGLAVEGPGRHDVFFDWSLRGHIHADGLAFSFRLPHCPLSIIELKLPAGQALVVDKNAGLVSGPFDAERPDVKVWRLQSSGRSQIEAVVRTASESSAPRLVLATLESKQQLTRSAVLADYDFRVEVAQGAATELVFEGDAVLEPYEVTVRGAELASWRTERRKDEGNNKADKSPPGIMVHVELREPLQTPGANVRIRCLSRRQAEAVWHSPALRMKQAVPRGETLVLQTAAPLQIERFDAGQFRVVHSGADADGGHIVRLLDLNPESAMPRRPRLWALGTPADLATREQTRWSIESSRMTLDADIACALRRGSLFQLAARLPAGPWLVDSVAVEPAGHLRTWTVSGPLLLVNLHKPLDPRHPVTLKLRLRSDVVNQGPIGTVSVTASIPEVRLNDVSSRQATYEIHVDASWTAALVRASVPLAAPEEATDVAAPRFRFAYGDQALVGTLELRPRRPAFTARVRQHVTLADERGSISARLDLEPVSGQASFGQVSFIDVFLAGGLADGWKASASDGSALSMQRAPGPETFGPISLLGAGTPLAAAASFLHLPRGQTYRLHFAKAAKGPASVTLDGEIKPAVLAPWCAALACLGPALGWQDVALGMHRLARQDWAPRRWTPPVVTVLGAEYAQGAVVVNPRDHAVLQPRLRGLSEQPDGGSSPVRLFHHQAHHGHATPPDLAFTTLPRRGASLSPNPIESLDVTHYVASDGSAHHHVQIVVAGRPETTLPLTFAAAELTVLGAKINGRWLELVQQEHGRNGLVVRLPIPSDDAIHRLELLLASPPPPAWWTPVGSIHRVEPGLPGPVLERRHRWRLAPGLAPLRRETMHSLDCDRGTPTDSLRRVWSAADSWLTAWMTGLGEPWRQPQRRALERVSADMQRPAAGATLGDAVQRLALEAVKIPAAAGGGTAVVLDRHALANLGLRRATALSPAVNEAVATGGLWEHLGLVATPTPEGMLLSDPAAFKVDQRGAEALRAAIAAAADAGQDSSGRFCRSDLWLSKGGDVSASSRWLSMLGANEADGWSEWTPLAATGDAAALLVVRTAPLRWAGIALGGLLFIMVGRLRPRWRPAMALRFLILSAVALGFALFAMPASLGDLAIWPLLAVAAHLAAEWFRCGKRGSGARAFGAGAARSALPLVVLAIALGSAARLTGPVAAQAENNEWLTVFYVDGGPERPLALVRPELMNKLEAMEHRSTLAHESAVIVAAAYTGRPQENAASGGPVRIDVQLDVHSFRDRSTLHLPLTAVELLEGAFVDGVPAFPAAAAGKAGFAGKPGFVVPLVGRGFHRVTLAVLARPQLQGDYQEIRCGIPAVALNRVTWQAPAQQTGLQLVRAAGEESTTLLEGGKMREIRAQLGRENVLHVRWLTAAAPSAIGHEVREAYWWDLDARAPSFTGQLRFTPSKANLGRVEIAIPEHLEIRSVELAATGAAVPPRLAKWQVLGKEPARRLRVDLAAPASGSFILRLHAAPRLSLDGGQLSLMLPTPLDAKSVEGVLAYRLPGADAADKTNELNVIVLAPEVFAKLWSQHGATAAAEPTRAYSFRRAGAAAGLVLALRPLAPRADCDMVWRLTPNRAEATARITWTASKPLGLVEVQLPAGLKLTGVRGPRLLYWSVHEQRLQAWLTQDGTQASLELAGWLAKPLVKQRFSLPAWTLPGIDETVATVKLTAPAGWTVEPETVSNLQRVGAESPLTYQSKAQKYDGVFRVRSPAPAAEFQALTRLEPRGGVLAVLAALEARATSGQLPAFSVRLRDWAAPVRLESSLTPLEQSHRREGNDQIWRLRFAPAGGRTVRIQLHSYVDAAAPVAVPLIEIEGGKLREQLVAWPELGVRISNVQGLSPAPAKLATWFTDIELLGGSALWRAEPGRPWSALVQSTATSDVPAVGVLHAEQQAALADGKRWLHRAAVLAHVGDARSFSIALPRGARLVDATVNGRRVQAFHVADERLTVPLPEHATLVNVELAWQYPQGAETLLRPNLAAPGLPQDGVTIHGVLLVAPGLGVSTTPAGWLVGDGHAVTGRFRAVAAAGNEDIPLESWPRREHVNRALGRRLEYLLDLDPRLQDALPDLRAELAAAGQDQGPHDHSNGFAAPLIPGLPISGVGLPLSWRTGAGPAGPDDAVASIILQADAAGPDVGDWVRELLTLALVSMFLLSWLPGGITWLTRLWPEAIAGLALIGCVAWGWSVVGGALLTAALLIRLLTLGRLLRVWMFQPASASPSAHT